MVASGYARTYQTQSVVTAGPGQLILMLYDGALRFMTIAKEAFDGYDGSPRRIEQINTNLIKAQNIISELRASLNHEIGGEYAKNLDRLYDYYLRRLFEANVRKDAKPLIEVEGLVRTLRDGWAEMLRSSEANEPQRIRGVA